MPTYWRDSSSKMLTTCRPPGSGPRPSRELTQLKERVGWQKAVVALANKNARILWAVLTREVAFNPNHVPQPPAARCALKPAA